MATGADIRIGGGEAFYHPILDYVQVPPVHAYFEPTNWFRTVFHELSHRTGHPSRLNRDQSGVFGSPAYAREELVAEMAGAFVCASLGVTPTVRHADYIGSWLEVLREDNRAITRAASAASKAADHILQRQRGGGAIRGGLTESLPRCRQCHGARVRGGREIGDGMKAREKVSWPAVLENPTMAAPKLTLSASRDIPFNKLVLSQSNVRTIKTGVSIEELAEDIARRTLLQSLNVRAVLDADGAETGMFEIPAGGRRYRALELLVKQKRLAKTALVPCVVRAEGLAEEDSLAENVQRAPLHPLDQFRAFKTLRDKGLGDEEIAARFFVSRAWSSSGCASHRSRQNSSTSTPRTR